jgi:hypothetical protein
VTAIGALQETEHAALQWSASSHLYQMPPRSISHEQKIQPVANGRPAAFRMSRKSSLLRTALSGLWPFHTTLRCSFRIAAIRAWRSIFVG